MFRGVVILGSTMPVSFVRGGVLIGVTAGDGKPGVAIGADVRIDFQGEPLARGIEFGRSAVTLSGKSVFCGGVLGIDILLLEGPVIAASASAMMAFILILGLYDNKLKTVKERKRDRKLTEGRWMGPSTEMIQPVAQKMEKEVHQSRP